MGSIVAALIGLCYGRIRARLGNTAILRLAAACWLTGFLIYGTTGQPVLLMLAPIFAGAGNALAIPALTALIGDTAPPELRGRATSLQGTAMFTGQFISPVLAGPLIAATTHTTGFLATAALAATLLLTLLTTKIATNPPADPTPAPPTSAHHDSPATRGEP